MLFSANPAKVKIIQQEGMVYVKGPLGIQKLKLINNSIDQKCIKKMIKGVTEGFSSKIKLVGVGYKAIIKKELEIQLGYNQPKKLPLEVEISTKSNGTIIEGKHKSLEKLSQYMSKIVLIRPAYKDIYKGKGVVRP